MDQSRPSLHPSQLADLPDLHVVYYTDPLCCWSWAFEPVWQELLKQAPGISWRYCMGGMLSSWDRYHDELRSVSRPAQMGPVWTEVKHITHAEIDSRLWVEDPPASSYPACVAVKTAMLQSPEAGAAYLCQLRKAVMTERKNIAKKAVLLDIAASTAELTGGALDLSIFTKQLAGKEATQAFRKDLEEINSKGIKRFPSLLISGKQYQGKLLLTGYRPVESLIQAIGKFSEREALWQPR